MGASEVLGQFTRVVEQRRTSTGSVGQASLSDRPSGKTAATGRESRPNMTLNQVYPVLPQTDVLVPRCQLGGPNHRVQVALPIATLLTHVPANAHLQVAVKPPLHLRRSNTSTVVTGWPKRCAVSQRSRTRCSNAWNDSPAFGRVLRNDLSQSCQVTG